MAFVIVLLSGIAGLVASLVALLGLGAGWSFALLVYLVASTVPAALIMAGLYVHMLVTRTLDASDSPAAEPQRARF